MSILKVTGIEYLDAKTLKISLKGKGSTYYEDMAFIYLPKGKGTEVEFGDEWAIERVPQPTVADMLASAPEAEVEP